MGRRPKHTATLQQQLHHQRLRPAAQQLPTLQHPHHSQPQAPVAHTRPMKTRRSSRPKSAADPPAVVWPRKMQLRHLLLHHQPHSHSSSNPSCSWDGWSSSSKNSSSRLLQRASGSRRRAHTQRARCIVSGRVRVLLLVVEVV